MEQKLPCRWYLKSRSCSKSFPSHTKATNVPLIYIHLNARYRSDNPRGNASQVQRSPKRSLSSKTLHIFFGLVDHEATTAFQRCFLRFRIGKQPSTNPDLLLADDNPTQSQRIHQQRHQHTQPTPKRSSHFHPDVPTRSHRTAKASHVRRIHGPTRQGAWSPRRRLIIRCAPNEKEDWSFGGGKAQFLTGDLWSMLPM